MDAIIDSESLEALRTKSGEIDNRASDLIDAARRFTWKRWSQSDFSIRFDGLGRYTYEQSSPLGLRETVLCDGQTLLHLYPQLHIGAKREVSRFHRADFAAMVPWFVPPAEDLNRGADVKLIGERTIAVVPHRDEKDKKWLQLHLVFAADGPLAERQLVQMPENKVLYRLICSPAGVVRLVDDAGKELARIDGKLEAAAAPKFTADTKDMVVLPLPYRTRDHVKELLKIESKNVNQLTFAEALPLFASEVAAGNASEANQIFQQVFHARNQRQLGWYVLLAACGQNLDSQNSDVLAEHLDEPLAQYLALHSSPVLRKHASQWAVSSQQWQEPFLQHLAVTHALFQRWQSDKVVKGGAAKVRTELERALAYARQNQDSLFGWAMLCLVQDQAGKNQDIHRALADAWLLFEKMPGLAGLAYAARYEHARSLFKSGQADKARAAFVQLYQETLKEERLPSIDADFRMALLVKGEAVDVWSELMEATARTLVGKERRPAALALAWQCWQVEDRALANHLLDIALAESKRAACSTEMKLAGLEFLWQTAQYPTADQHLERLLADAELAKRPGLWRFGVKLADQRGRKSRALECLERALELEAAQPPEVIDLESVREDYGRLLGHYQDLADAMITLKIAAPDGFLAKVVRTADRWRAVDRDAAPPSNLAARILQTLEERDLAWDYLTTPVAMRPNEADSWVALAGTLRTQGDVDLAELAYKAASESEPTNAQILWDRAENLSASGQVVPAQRLFRQIAEGDWQPRFQGLRNQAKLRLR